MKLKEFHEELTEFHEKPLEFHTESAAFHRKSVVHRHKNANWMEEGDHDSLCCAAWEQAQGKTARPRRSTMAITRRSKVARPCEGVRWQDHEGEQAWHEHLCGADRDEGEVRAGEACVHDAVLADDGKMPCWKKPEDRDWKLLARRSLLKPMEKGG